MFPRAAQTRLHDLAASFPAVLILGARQVGKTTLARESFADLPYCDLEDPATRALFSEDARFQIEARARPAVILDEAQSVPDVFPALRGIIDADRAARGRFILLGSAQPTLVRQVSETLAGRVGILELDPLTADEASGGGLPVSWEHAWIRGGFPDALLTVERGTSFRDWWEAYLRTYVERDLPALGLGAEPLRLRRLLTMLAHSQGGLANLSRLGASLGVSFGTVSRYLDILEQTFLLRRLAPYFTNIGKRLVKSPKLYLRDTGLVHHLLGVESADALLNHPIRGPSWETFVIEDIARRERTAHPHSQLFFWRTAAGAELDLVIERDGRRFGVEIKAGASASPHLGRTLASIALDLELQSVTVIDQKAGVEPLRPGVQRRGFSESLGWLP